MQIYNEDFYTLRERITRQSADEICPLLYRVIKPSSVIDLGCATGVWLDVLTQLGVNRVTGVDGAWVDRSMLNIPDSDFVSHNLQHSAYPVSELYDMALCIEVAEHLTESMGDELIETLTAASEVIVFSAAVAGQGGTGHINEQPQSYWVKKFLHRGYVAVDLLRPAIWQSVDVNVIYKQNLILYVRENAVSRYPELMECIIESAFDSDRVHPDLLKKRNDALRRCQEGRVLARARKMIRSLFR